MSYLWVSERGRAKDKKYCRTNYPNVNHKLTIYRVLPELLWYTLNRELWGMIVAGCDHQSSLTAIVIWICTFNSVRMKPFHFKCTDQRPTDHRQCTTIIHHHRVTDPVAWIISAHFHMYKRNDARTRMDLIIWTYLHIPTYYRIQVQSVCPSAFLCAWPHLTLSHQLNHKLIDRFNRKSRHNNTRESQFRKAIRCTWMVSELAWHPETTKFLISAPN